MRKLTAVKYIWDDRDNNNLGWVECKYYEDDSVEASLIDRDEDASIADLTWGLNRAELSSDTPIEIYSSMATSIVNKTFYLSDLEG